MNRAQRSQQLWSILALAAENNQILTYNRIAKATGLAMQGIGGFLSPIQQYCTENNYPPLTSIVVSDQTGVPSDGFIAAENIPLAHREVFNFNWLEHRPPTEQQLTDAYSRAPDAR